MRSRRRDRLTRRRLACVGALLGLLVAACGGADTTHVRTQGASPPTTTARHSPDPVQRLVGAVDRAVMLAPGYVTVDGWVRSVADAPPVVTVLVDGLPEATIVADVDAPATAPPDARGFAVDVAVDDTAAGTRPDRTHRVCVEARPQDAGPADTATAAPPATSPTTSPLGCTDTTTLPGEIPVDAPTSELQLTAVAPQQDGTLDVRGVMTASAPVHTVEVTAHDDEATGPAEPEARLDDVPVRHGAFRTTLDPLDGGHHTICAAARTPSGAELGSACGAVVIGALSAGTTGTPAAITPVGPAVDHRLHEVQRDAGITAPLSDGSLLWFFGDSSERAGGGHAYFVNNTAAWAPAGDPTTTCDWVSDGGEPALFAEPPAGWCEDSEYPNSIYWPTSAVTIPRDDGTDRVLVFLVKVCQAPGFLQIEDHGLALAEYVYDPRTPPDGQPITGEVIVETLASAARPFGESVVLGADGLIYGYDCRFRDGGDGDCGVARVEPDEVHRRAAWRYWNGGDPDDASSWTRAIDQAAPMSMPAAGVRSVPIAMYTVLRLPEEVCVGTDTSADGPRHDGTATDGSPDDSSATAAGAYAMVYSPWPAFTDRLVMRFAPTPAGPWTAPLDVELPGCDDEVDGRTMACYAGTGQAALCETGAFGMGYFDQHTDGRRGQYHALRVPLIVTDQRLTR